ncbi:uncharacterized protein CXorf49-like [Lemur catta]|uniref:uncharacterized protein CXorf49-like n=2 Tax=Lemur catta TaxID=9447 RepID=UPI001E267A43|nr:uncharacterized protein CXorf49-like [Lemur catta]
MSSSDEVSVSGAAFGLEGGERASVCPASPGARGPGLDLDLGAPRGGEGQGEGEGEGALADPEGFEAEREVIEGGGAELWGREGRPGTTTDQMWEEPDYESLLADESVAIVQPLSDWAVRGVGTHPSSEGWDAQVSTVWPDLQAGPTGRGALAPSAAPLPLLVPRKVRARGYPKRGAKSRPTVGGRDPQRPSEQGLVELPSDPESPDEFSEVPMRVSIYPKGGDHGVPGSPEQPGDTLRHSILLVREDFLPMPGPFVTSAPQGLTSGTERQAVGELHSSSSNLPQAAPRKKVAQEKMGPGAASDLALGGAFPPWGRRLSAVALEPATFPPVVGVPLLGTAQRCSLLSSGPKQSKPSSTGKKSVPRKAKEPQPVARDADDPNSDPVPKAQMTRPSSSCLPTLPLPGTRIFTLSLAQGLSLGVLPRPRSGQTSLHMHRGEFSSDDPNTRAPQAPGNSQATALSQGGVTPRGPAPSSDQEPPVHAPRPERQQEPPGAQDCPECAELEREIDDLKERLAAMESILEKFQAI